MAKRSVGKRVAVCLCLLGIAAAPDLLARFADWQASIALRRLPGVSLAEMSRESGTGRLVLRDVAVARDGVRVSIGRLALARQRDGLGLVASASAEVDDGLAGAVGAARARAAASQSGKPKPAEPPGEAAQRSVPPAVPDPAVTLAEDVRIVAQGRVYRVPRLELRGTRLNAADLAGLLDPAQPATLADRLSRFSAAVVQAPELDIETDPATPGQAIALHGIVLTGVLGGRIGTLAVDSITETGSTAADRSRVATGPIRADLVDLPLVAAILDGSRSDAGTPVTPLFASASVEAIALGRGDGTGGNMTIGALRLGALRGRPLPRSLDELKVLGARSPASLSLEERRTLAGAFLDLSASFALDHLELADMRFQDGTTPPRRFDLGRLTLDGLGARGNLSLGLAAVRMEAPEANLKLDRAVLWGFDQSRLTDLATRVHGGSDLAAALSSLAAEPARFAVAIDGAAVSTPSTDGHGNDADGTRIRAALPEIGMSGDQSATGTSTFAAHLRVAAPMPTPLPNPQIASLGLSALDVTADYDASYERNTQKLDIDRFAVRAAGLGAVTLGAVLGHLAPLSLSLDSDAQRRATGDMTVESVSVRFVNEGLVEKALPLMAASAQVSLPVFKASLKAQATVLIAQQLGDTPTATRLEQAISSFVDDPRSLSIAVTIPGAQTIAALQAKPADTLLRGMEITASANR